HDRCGRACRAATSAHVLTLPDAAGSPSSLVSRRQCVRIGYRAAMRVFVVLVVACGSTSAPKPPPPTPAPPADAAVVVVAIAHAPPPPPPPIDAAALALDAAPPKLTAPATRIAVKAAATVGGIAIKFTANNHKHPAGPGRALGIWSFEVAGQA